MFDGSFLTSAEFQFALNLCIKMIHLRGRIISVFIFTVTPAGLRMFLYQITTKDH